jgi:penicillin amidase
LGGFDDFRGRYINRQLAKMDKVTPEDMMALQHDSHSLQAEEALPLMLAALEGQTLDPTAKEAQAMLAKWDYRYTADSRAAVLFHSWYDSLYMATFDEIKALESDTRPMEYPEDWRFIELMDKLPADPIFDHKSTKATEDAAALARQTFAKAVATVMPLLATGTTWNSHRDSRILHLAKIPGFDSGLITSDGTKNAPNAMTSVNGPSWRMIVSLEQPIRAWVALPGGSSGNPGSPFYKIGVDDWASGKYAEVRLFASADEVGPGRRLVFGNH